MGEANQQSQKLEAGKKKPTKCELKLRHKAGKIKKNSKPRTRMSGNVNTCHQIPRDRSGLERESGRIYWLIWTAHLTA